MNDFDMIRELQANDKRLKDRLGLTEVKEVPLYSKGTFSPTFSGSSGGATWTYTTQAGFYTRIGNRCFFNLSLVTSARAGAPLGNAIINNMPFTSDATANSHSPCDLDSIQGFTLTGTIVQLTARVTPGLPWIEFVETTGTAPPVANLLAAGALNAGLAIRVAGHYIIA